MWVLVNLQGGSLEPKHELSAEEVKDVEEVKEVKDVKGIKEANEICILMGKNIKFRQVII